MDRRFETYLENARASRRLMKPEEPFSGVGDDLLRAVQANVRRQMQLRKENDAILQDPELGVSLPADELSPEQAAGLEEFANSLSCFMAQADNALSYRLHRLLLEYATQHGDLDGQIRESYHTGLALYYLNKEPNNCHMQLFNAEIKKRFSFSAGMLDRLEQFGNSETKGYILRSYANIKLGFDTGLLSSDTPLYPLVGADTDREIAHIQQEIALFSDPALRALAPDFRWDAALYAVHMGMTVFLTLLREKSDARLARLVLRSATYLHDYEATAAQNENRMVQPRIDYIYNAARYHCHLLSLDELLRFFETRVRSGNTSAYGLGDLFDNIYCPLYYIDYYMHFCLRSAQGDADCDRMREHLREYLRAMPLNDYYPTVSGMLARSFPQGAGSNDAGQQTYLLDCLLSLHRPTCVHSLLTAFLTRLLTERLLETDPSVFDGGGKDGSCAAADRTALLQHAWELGLYHDVGKLAILETIGQYGRSLLPEEWEAIHAHCYIGYRQLLQLPFGSRCALGALGHHRWYDGQGGYPACYTRRQGTEQVLIDILSVADSIEAATNQVGRCYRPGVELGELCRELFRESGTRYAPYVIGLLKDTAFYDSLKNRLEQARRAAYLFVWKQTENAGSIHSSDFSPESAAMPAPPQSADE